MGVGGPMGPCTEVVLSRVKVCSALDFFIHTLPLPSIIYST